jgi:hypothetical protein
VAFSPQPITPSVSSTPPPRPAFHSSPICRFPYRIPPFCIRSEVYQLEDDAALQLGPRVGPWDPALVDIPCPLFTPKDVLANLSTTPGVIPSCGSVGEAWHDGAPAPSTLRSPAYHPPPAAFLSNLAPLWHPDTRLSCGPSGGPVDRRCSMWQGKSVSVVSLAKGH